MKIFLLTSTPSFYKDNLFLKLSQKCTLKVLYTNNEKIKRNKNFYSNNFKNIIYLRKWNIFLNIIHIFKGCNYDSIILSGWDDSYYWLARLVFPKKKLKIIIESSIYEYRSNLFLDFLKKYFLKGFSIAIVSGTPQENLIQNFKFKGKIIKSYGVGILDFNYYRPQKNIKTRVSNFLYIGRITKIKGIDFLIRYFKKNQSVSLILIGEYEDLNYKNIISEISNIRYLGYKNREELFDVFTEADVLVLPSLIEPWGLVVEEALYHGLPVIVSNKVGCSFDVVKKNNLGLVFDSQSFSDFEHSMNVISNYENYELIRENIYKYNFVEKELTYLNSFLSV